MLASRLIWCAAAAEAGLPRTGAKLVEAVGAIPVQGSVDASGAAQQTGAVRRKPGKGARLFFCLNVRRGSNELRPNCHMAAAVC